MKTDAERKAEAFMYIWESGLRFNVECAYDKSILEDIPKENLQSVGWESDISLDKQDEEFIYQYNWFLKKLKSN